MRFYAALIASLLSNHRNGGLIGARGVSPTESVSARVRQWKKGRIGPNIRWWTRIRAVHGLPFGNGRLPVESDTRHTGAEAGLKYARGCKRK